MTGNVKWYDDRKSYGFITPEGGGPDIFVHSTGWDERPRRTPIPYDRPDDNPTDYLAGTRVEFEVRDGRKGPECHHVRVMETKPAV